MSDPSRVRVSGPLEPFAAGFARELSRLGYTSISAIHQVRLLGHLSRWLADKGHATQGLFESEVERFLAARRAAGRPNHLTGKAMQPMLQYLRELGVAPPPPLPPTPEGPLEEALDRYRHYLTVERGVGSASARGYLDAVRPFLRGRVSADGRNLDLVHLTAADVTAFVVARCPLSIRKTPSALDRNGLRTP